MWCRPCQDLIVDAIGRLPELCARLSPGRIARPTGDTDENRRATVTGSPSLSPAWDEIDAVIRFAVDAEDRLRAHLGHSNRSRVRHRVLTDAVTYLTAQSTAWLCTPWAAEDGRATLVLARRVEVAAGADRLVHRLAAPCPACEMRGLVETSLIRDDGADHVSCRICGSSWPEAEYRRLTLVLASAVKDEAS